MFLLICLSFFSCNTTPHKYQDTVVPLPLPHPPPTPNGCAQLVAFFPPAPVSTQNQLLDFSGRHLALPSLSCSPSNAAAASVSGLHLGAVVVVGIPGKDSILYVCVWESLYVCKRSYLRHLLFAQFVPPLVPPAYLAR